jgi:hypothetical protein
VTCAYSEPNCASEIADRATRCSCGRFVKRCPECAAHNRAFAHYCRGCGASLPQSAGNWTGSKGGPRRLGASASSVDAQFLTRATDLHLRLGDACHTLLGYDGHVIAIARNGTVEIADPLRARSVCRFQAQGAITADPCISEGVLYLPMRGQLSAYALAAMTLQTPRVRPLWQVPLNGTPIHTATPAGSRLYVTVASPGRREVQVIEHQTVRPLHGARNVSWIAADASGSRAVFFSDDGDGVHLHVADTGLSTHAVSVQRLIEQQPIAFVGGTVFGVFGETNRLYRIDAATGGVEEPMDEDTQFFALTDDGSDVWDRDSVHIDTRGVSFARAGIRDAFSPYDRVTRGSPVIVRGCAVAVGMTDGRVLVYDVAQLPHHEVWRPGANSGSAITALATFDSFLAAGNDEGRVEVRQFVAKGAAA